jgi:ACS family tartrate transporter-like MFS transporter
MSADKRVGVFPESDSAKGRVLVFRKISMRLLPLLILSFVVSYIDRTNVGFAALTMNRDLGLTATEFGWGAGVLFLGYCFFEVPSNLALHHYGARRWIARIMITWGIIAIATAWVSGPWGFYIMRFLLGLAEAGFTPGVMYLLVAWYPMEYRSRVLSVFQLSVPIASLISGPLSSAILLLDSAGGLAGWRWIFLIEGAPAVVLGLIVFFYLDDRPQEATWLSAEEKQLVASAIEAEKRDRPVGHFWGAMSDPRVLILAGIQFGFTIGSYAVGIWLPLILKQHQLSNIAVGLVAAIPYLFGCAASLIWSWRVDKSGRRTSNLAIACLIGAAGLLFLVLFKSLLLDMVGLSIALVGITSARGIFWSIPPRFLTGIGAAAGLAFINSVGTFGGFVGPVTVGWLKDLTGSFTGGLSAIACLIAVSAALTWPLRLTMRHE